MTENLHVDYGHQHMRKYICFVVDNVQVGNDYFDTYHFEWYILTRFYELYILRFQNMKIGPHKYVSFTQSLNIMNMSS